MIVGDWRQGTGIDWITLVPAWSDTKKDRMTVLAAVLDLAKFEMGMVDIIRAAQWVATGQDPYGASAAPDTPDAAIWTADRDS